MYDDQNLPTDPSFDVNGDRTMEEASAGAALINVPPEVAPLMDCKFMALKQFRTVGQALRFYIYPSLSPPLLHATAQREANAVFVLPAPPLTFATAVGALFSLYCLFETQPFRPRVNIQISTEQLDVFSNLVPYFEIKQAVECMKIFQVLWRSCAFEIRPPQSMQSSAIIRANNDKILASAPRRISSVSYQLMENKAMRESLFHMRYVLYMAGGASILHVLLHHKVSVLVIIIKSNCV